MPIRACRPRSCCCRSACPARRRSRSPGPSRRRSRPDRRRAQALRRFRSPHTLWPHAQFLSNGSYTTVVTNAGGGASFCRGRVVTRYREDATRDPGSQFIYLRDVRSGTVWSATHHPTRAEPGDYLVTFLPEKATFSRRDDGDRDAARDRGVHGGRRRGAAAVGDEPQRPPARDRDHELRGDRARLGDGRPGPPRVREALRGDGVPPGKGGASLRASAALARGVGALGRPRAEPRGPDARSARVGDGPLALPGPRARARRSAGPRRTLVVGHDRRRARSHRQPAPARPPRARRLRAAVFRHGDGAHTRHGAGARAEVPRAELGGAHLRPRLCTRAERAPAPRHHERGSAPLRAAGVARAVRRPLAARGSCRSWPGTSSARRGCGPTASRAISRSCWCGWSRRTICRSSARCCRRRSTGGSRGCAPTS